MKSVAQLNNLASLKTRIAQLENRPVDLVGDDAAPWSFGADALDQHVGALGQGDVHLFGALSHGDGPAVQALALSLLSRLPDRRPILWVSDLETRRHWGEFCLSGLSRFGIEHGRLLMFPALKPVHMWRAMHEGLASKALAATVGMGAVPNFTTSRRLRLAASEAGMPCLLLTGHGPAGPMAAGTSWRVASLPSAPNPHDPRAPGRPRWRLALERARHCAPASCDVEWDDAALSFHMVSQSGLRPAAAPTAPPAFGAIGKAAGWQTG